MRSLASNFMFAIRRAAVSSGIVALRLVGAVAVFGLTVWIARKFGTATYGYFAYITALSSFVGLACQLGLDFLALKNLPNHRGDNLTYPKSHYLGSVRIIFVVSVGLVAAITASIFVSRPAALLAATPAIFFAMGAGLSLSPLNVFLLNIYTAAGKAVRGYAIDRLLFAFLTFLFSGVAYLLGLKTALTIVICFTLSNLALFLIYTAQIYSGTICHHLSGPIQIRGKFIELSLVYLAVRKGLVPSIAQVIDQLSPVFLILAAGLTLSAADTGLLSVALAVGGVLNLTTQAIETSLLAELSTAVALPSRERRTVLKRLWLRSAIPASILLAFALLMTWCFGHSIFAFVSPSFSEADAVLYWILLGFGSRALSIAGQDILLLMDRGYLVARINTAILFLLTVHIALGPPDVINMVRIFCGYHVVRSAIIIFFARSIMTRS